MDFHLKNVSAWTFDTSGNFELGLSFFAGSGGEILLYDPQKHDHTFRYGAAGLGYSWGFHKIPKIGPRLDPKGLTGKGALNVAPTFFTNRGTVIKGDKFGSRELTLKDFQGMCCLVDIGISFIGGGSAMALAVNVNPAHFLAAAAGPIGTLLAPPLNPSAIILVAGLNVGVQANAGVSAQVGYLWLKG